ncbi:hypothetical protein M5D96_003368 [Drosophila gunungcola]|uniref:Uncharacterized protein n=1 Tax=Drosophila gunungcola TaxID=103775 RepID=A0A9P9YSQ4_9MUSC|nr:hypothetical protein M5D96_003368 [Drosophila gunungcola]
MRRRISLARGAGSAIVTSSRVTVAYRLTVWANLELAKTAALNLALFTSEPHDATWQKLQLISVQLGQTSV